MAKLDTSAGAFSLQDLLGARLLETLPKLNGKELRGAYGFLALNSRDFPPAAYRLAEHSLALITVELKARENKKTTWLNASLAAIAITLSAVQIAISLWGK